MTSRIVLEGGISMDAALIGLGQMGAGIAKSLLRAGHRLKLYNRTVARAEALLGDGAVLARSVAEACQEDVVMTMVADDAALETVTFGQGGIAASLKPGAIHVSLSTISAAMSERLAAEHARLGQEYVAAPVFGRPDAAESARLAVVAAGKPEAVQRCKPLLEAMGPKLLVASERPAIANVIKLIGNFLLGSVIESLAEAFALGRKSGVDEEQLFEFLTTALFPIPVYRNYGEAILRRRFAPAGFAASLGLKDIRLVLAAGEAQSVPMPIASVLRDRLLAAIARGNAESDWSVLGRIAAEDAGIAASR
jgi:3-hydroxyisobutyrate dehydrogenase-like beta-hydroxyacid dehydrogenase